MNSVTRFEPAPDRLTLQSDDVHLWLADVHSIPAGGASILSRHEQSRAVRFHFEKDRIAFNASRIFRRTVLSRYVGVPPVDLRFTEGEFGKPRLTSPVTDLSFNVTHSGHSILIAISRRREVGVDLELIRDSVAFDDIGDRYFEPGDVLMLRSASSEEKAATFFKLWTQMEARLKAIGTGLGNTVADSRTWTTQHLIPGEGYIAALVVEGGLFRLSCWS